MNLKIILTKCICLLYREAQIDQYGQSDVMIKSILKTIRLKEKDITGTESVLKSLKEVVESIMAREDMMPKREILQAAQIACSTDTALFESIQDDILVDIEDQSEIVKQVLSYRFQLNKYLKNQEAEKLIEKLYQKVKFEPDTVDNMDEFLSSNAMKITELISYSGEVMPGIISEIDFDDVKQIEEAMQESKEQAEGKLMIKTPWQALQRMTQGGLRLGDLVLPAGLQGAGKSFISRNLFLAACCLNDPKPLMKDPKKKPLNITFSFEDSQILVINDYYRILKGVYEGVYVNQEHLRNITPGEASDWLSKKVRQTGYSVRFINNNPSEVSYMDIINQLIRYETEGYEVHTVLIDYLSLANRNGLGNVRSDQDIQELFRRVKNYCLSKRILLLAPHQLSTEALEIKRNNDRYLARTVAALGYYQDSKGLGREPELEIVVDKVVDNGKSYMAFARGKHRGVGDTPEKDKFFILPFTEWGLAWDIDTIDTSLTKFGQERTSTGEVDDDFAVAD